MTTTSQPYLDHHPAPSRSLCILATPSIMAAKKQRLIQLIRLVWFVCNKANPWVATGRAGALRICCASCFSRTASTNMGARHSVVMEEEISSRCRDFLLSARLRFLILCNNMRLTPQASPQIRKNAQTGAMPFLMLLEFCIRSPDPTFNYLICMQGNVSKNWKERWCVEI